MILARIEPADAQLDSPLGQVSPVLKLAIAFGWLLGLALTTAIAPPLALAAVAFGAGLTVGGIRPATLARVLAPLWIAALGIGLSNALFSAANADPTSTILVTFGPIRLTTEAVRDGVALACRVIAIASVGAVFTLTTDSTRLVDSLVQQGRVPERFAYGALAAYGAIPRFGEDLATLRQARRIRGLRGDWHPRLLVTLLVLAIRHGDRVALAMDARAFGIGPRSRYRDLHWSASDLVVGAAAAAILALALALPSIG